MRRLTKGIIMKKALYLIFIVLLFNCTTTKQQESTKQNNNEEVEFSISQFMSNNSNESELPDQYKINIIYYILQNTQERNIHKMRGETDNIVLVNEDGREAVYGGNGDIVTNLYNKGSYNYFDYKKEPIKKFIVDILPWLELGNDPNDPTTQFERLYYYTLDLGYGIQTYILKGRKQELLNVDISTLSQDEIDTYALFEYIIFNEDYGIKFNDDNMEKLEVDGDYYWTYFYQIHKLLGILQE